MTSYMVALSTGNDIENSALRPVGRKFNDAVKVYDETRKVYQNADGVFTVSLAKVETSPKSVTILKEDVVGKGV